LKPASNKKPRLDQQSILWPSTHESSASPWAEPHFVIRSKSKVKLSRYTPLRSLGGEEVKLLLILNLGTRWEWMVSYKPRPRFTPVERTQGTHWTGGWVGPRAGLEAEARRKILCLCRGSNPGHPVRSQSLYWLTYPGSNKYIYRVSEKLLWSFSDTYLFAA
jgi:hypothetical protein